MDTKKIIIIVLAIVLLAVGYAAYAKGIKPVEALKDALQKKQDEAVVIEQKKQELKDGLTETQKQEAAVLARAIFEDMKGWNDHNMSLYKKLYESSKEFFLYFVEEAYPAFDTKSFRERLKMQNFRIIGDNNRSIFDKLVVTKKEKAEMDAAEALIAKIVSRMIEFKV